MALTKIYSLFKSLEDQSVLLSFKGVVTSELLTSVLQIMESKLVELEVSQKVKRKVFNVLVECLQNLFHHVESGENLSLDKEEVTEFKTALFLVTKTDKGFNVRTGNYVGNKLAKVLEKKIEKINTLDKEELRKYYQNVLSEGERSSKGTAGLGMIDIARKSGNKLEYEFIDVEGKYKFFCLNVLID